MIIELNKKSQLPSVDTALPGRQTPMIVESRHYVNKKEVKSSYPTNYAEVFLGLGCFWGAERKFWELEGVFSTSAGYAAGITKNPTYREVCTGMTGHNEVVLVVYDPEVKLVLNSY